MEESKLQYYLRREKGVFGFILEGTGDIKETDIKILIEDYNRFFDLQSEGKHFKLKEVPTGERLFDYIEEYTPEVLEVTPEPGIDEFMLDVDYRLSKLELGV